MPEGITQALINAASVFVGLFVLWSFVTQMRRQPASLRAQAALLAGIVSGLVTWGVYQLV